MSSNRIPDLLHLKRFFLVTKMSTIRFLDPQCVTNLYITCFVCFLNLLRVTVAKGGQTKVSISGRIKTCFQM